MHYHPFEIPRSEIEMTEPKIVQIIPPAIPCWARFKDPDALEGPWDERVHAWALREDGLVTPMVCSDGRLVDAWECDCFCDVFQESDPEGGKPLER